MMSRDVVLEKRGREEKEMIEVRKDSTTIATAMFVNRRSAPYQIARACRLH